jgi:hypothetical protein
VTTGIETVSGTITPYAGIQPDISRDVRVFLGPALMTHRLTGKTMFHTNGHFLLTHDVPQCLKCMRHIRR